MKTSVHDLLEKHFETAFAVPDGIAKLRELILTLAMRGKLVPQDPNDPPASELLKEIEAEKQRLIQEGKIKKPKPLPPIKPEEVPYELPQGWEWVRLIEIGSWALGSGLPHTIQGDKGQEILLCKVSDMNLPGNEKFIVTTNNTVSEKVAQQNKLNISEPGTIIFPKIGGAIATNKRRILQKKTVIDNNCLGITPASAMNLEWCYQLLLSFDFAKYQTGTSVPAISQGIIGEIIIGLPPAPEQHRIVARIDQLMARCDALETLRKQREEKRLAVHTVAIKKLLDAPDGSAWDFIQQHFGELYTVKENVAELRKAILQLAVMGRLVPQDPNDPPASELLKEIEAEKQRLIKEGKIKKPKPLPPIKPEEMPYLLPQGWEWVRLGDISLSSDSGWSPQCLSEKRSHNQWGVLKVSAVSWRRFNPDENKALPPDKSPRPECEVKVGDFLLSRANTAELVARSVIVEDTPRKLMMSDKIVRFDLSKHVNKYFINIANGSDFSRSYYMSNASGTSSSMKNVSRQVMAELPIPLPPLPEQHRIVARVDQLMALCDTLEQQIDAATGKQTELLNAVMVQV